MYLIYYFLQDIKTGEIHQEVMDTFVGDIGDRIALSGTIYEIIDWTEEFEDLEEPEDY